MKALAAVLSLIAIALGFVVFKQNQTIADLEAEIAKNAATTETAPASDPGKDTSEAATLASSTPAPTSTTPPAPADEDGINSRERMMRDISTMMENPQMNEIMQASQRGTLEVLYKDLLTELDFTPEEREHFMDILMARQMFRVETSMKMMGGGISPEEMKLLGEEMKEYDESIKKEIDYFLNNETDVGEFEFYEKTIQERMSLSGMKASLAQTGTPLDSATERGLLEIMAEQKDNYQFKSNLADPNNYDLSSDRFSDENVDNFVLDMETLHQLIEQEAAAILTPEQLDVLGATLANMRQLQISQLKMAANMFKSKG